MPTGYTSIIGEKPNVTFEEYALRCARNFGALAMMRDDRLDAPIPDDFETAPYYKEAVLKADLHLTELRKMLPGDAEAAAEKDYDEQLKSALEYDSNKLALREKYQQLLAVVLAWTPPTPEHEGLKSFMASQLEESLQFDCTLYPRLIERKSGAVWLAESLHEAEENLRQALQNLNSEIVRCEGRTQWVQQLKKSLRVVEDV